MPLRILSAEELAVRRARGIARPEYVEALAKMQPGQGAEIDVAEEGVGRGTIKGRLIRAAEQLAIPIAFVRSSEATVLFEVLASEPPKAKRRGRPAKAAGSS